jgi:hypothetical protein
MFALPNPIQRSSSELAAAATFASNTATSPYPTHQTISTPPSSRSKGDWGFKRPLPLRSTSKTSTPLIRISAIDTLEHITEFSSAADHALTLQKWQELNMPLTTPGKTEESYVSRSSTKHKLVGRGVFEEDTDITAYRSDLDASNDNRWKFNGPWLAGQTDAEFSWYVEKEVSRRKDEFRAFLRNHRAAVKTKAAKQKAIEDGEDVPQAIEGKSITDEDLQKYLLELRQDQRQLFQLIREFLDLPPAPVFNDQIDSLAASITRGLEANPFRTRTIKSEDYTANSESPYANTGPPKTHPSAGLSYLRTASHVYNHPIYGPQAHPSPVQARIIQPKNATVGSFAPKLGVAGIVTEVPPKSENFNSDTWGSKRNRNSRGDMVPGLLNIEPEKVGGSKVFVRPKSATIDTKGRIMLTVSPAESAAVAIHQGVVGQVPTDMRRSVQPTRGFDRPATTTSTGYGLRPEGQGGFGPRTRDTEGLSSRRLVLNQGPRSSYKELESLLEDSVKKE